MTRRLPPPARRAVLSIVRRARRLRGPRRPVGRDLRRHAPVEAPAVAVVVTSRNRAELLHVALRSIQEQDFEAFECVVVDDDSTDDALLEAQRFAAVDGRFRVLVHDESRGPSAARNTGLAAVRAPLVCFLDDDDFLLAGSLRARVEALEGQPTDVAGAYCDWVNVDEDVGLEAFVAHRRAVRRPTVSFSSLASGTPFILSAPVVRTEVLRGEGAFDEELVRAEDADLWFRLVRLGHRFVAVDHVGVAYRRSAGSLVTGAPAAQLAGILRVYERAERPAPELAGRGPLPHTRPLGEAVAAHARRVGVLRYVAMIAASDAEAAVEHGAAALPPASRREIDPDVEAEPLAEWAASRLALGRRGQRELVETLRGVLGELAVAPATTWRWSTDGAAWSGARASRAAVVGPPPRTAGTVAAADLDGAIVLIPEARYHVDELGPLGDELSRRGVPVRYMLSEKTVPNAVAELGRYTEQVLPYRPELIGRARAVVTLNDWGPLKALVLDADRQGVATFAKVEGVQDFDDVESSWERNPYRSAAVILAQGANDMTALPEKDTAVVGSSRLERLWLAPPVVPTDHALVNLNFTFNVLTDRRDMWLRTVNEGLQRAGIPGLVSKHPAERGDTFDLAVATKPFRHEVTRAGLLVSRFSTVAFEAMARGVPFVYHNPHGERFPAFQRPDGAFEITRSADDLAGAAGRALGWRPDYRSRCEAFFRQQVDVVAGRTSAQRAADVVLARS